MAQSSTYDPLYHRTTHHDVSSCKVLRIYWPTNLRSVLLNNKYQQSVLIGWKNTECDLVVVTALPYLDPALVESLLSKNLLLKTENLTPNQLYSVCGVSKMSILGTLNYDPETQNQFLNSDRRIPQFIPSKSFFNVKFDRNSKHPVILHSPNSQLHSRFQFKFVQMITFDPPISSKLQYFSLKPASLELPEKTSFTVISEQLEQKLVEQEKETQELCRKVKDHADYDPDELNSLKTTLDNCIAQLNTCNELGIILRKNSEDLFPKILNATSRAQQSLTGQINFVNTEGQAQLRSRKFSISQIIAVDSAKSYVQNGILGLLLKIKQNIISPIIVWALIYVIMVFRILAEGILKAIEWKPFKSWYALKEVSATAQQIDLRLQQFCYSPVQYLKISKNSVFSQNILSVSSTNSETEKKLKSGNPSSNIGYVNVEYVLFYNTIWLIVNDVIIGITLSKLILEYQKEIISYLIYIIDYPLTNDFEKTIAWLMRWPGGLKLNTELASFCGGLFIWVIHFWRHIILSFFVPVNYGDGAGANDENGPFLLRMLVLFVAYSGLGGATLLMSLVSDLVSFVTIHVYSFYLASGKIYHWQLTVLQSLFHLFRGKKRNILRNRVDSCSYELDQLLMGTIFFTSLVFLLPTVLVFYLTFAACRLGIIIINAVLESCLACLNHFPLFALMLYFKDYKRLPGGISFILLDDKITYDDNSQGIVTSHIMLKPLHLPFSTIFFQYRLLYSRIRFLYMSLPVILRLLSGQFVPIQRSQLYSLLYSKLPKERVGVSKLYQELTSSLREKKKQ